MTQLKSPFGMRLFMISPDSQGRIQIRHPAAAANCSRVPILPLIEMVLSQTGAQLDPVGLLILLTFGTHFPVVVTANF